MQYTHAMPPTRAGAQPAPAPTFFPLVLIVCALAGGIALDRLYPLAAGVWIGAAAAAAALWLVCWLGHCNRLASVMLLAGFFAVGGAHHHNYWRLFGEDEIGRSLDEMLRPAVIEAEAITSPRWVPAPPPTPRRTIPQGEHCELIVKVTAIRDGRTFRPASGLAELQVGGNLTGIRAGDRLRIMAQAGRPAAPLNPGEFDFAVHLRAERQLCRLFAEFPESVERLSDGSALSPRRWLAAVRGGGGDILRHNIAPNRATLAAALLIGAREQLDADRNEGYLVTGTIHVLSISGLHVGILAAGFFFLLHTGLVPRTIALAATITLTVIYALLTDLQPPVVRATILVVIACLALWTGRSSIGFNALAAAAIIVLILNPSALFLAGPQLSFLAAATMIAFHPLLVPPPITDPLDRLIAASRPRLIRISRHIGGVLWRPWLTGALIWLISTPLVWKQYNLISPVALVLNFLMWLPVTLAMYSGLGTLLFGSFAPFAGRICGLICDRCLDSLERLIAWGHDWPAGYFWLPAPPMWWIGVFYIALGIAVAVPRIAPPRRWAIALIMIWSAVALLMSSHTTAALYPPKARPLICHFVSVGHGVSVLVEFPDGKTLLYDSGRLGSPLAGIRPISSVLWSRGITHLDAIVISHADADHFNAIPGLLERFSVGAIYVSPAMFDRMQPAVQELHDAINQRHIPVRQIHAGQKLTADDTTKMEILHPPRHGLYRTDNASSIVLLIEHAGRRLLMTGDLESPGLDDVLAEEPLDCDVVLAPHHGSPRSSPSRFAQWCDPEFVVISGRRGLGADATIDSVQDYFRLNGAEVLHTADDGCVRVEISPSRFAVSTFRPHVRAIPAAAASTNFLQSE